MTILLMMVIAAKIILIMTNNNDNIDNDRITTITINKKRITINRFRLPTGPRPLKA